MEVTFAPRWFILAVREQATVQRAVTTVLKRLSKTRDRGKISLGRRGQEQVRREGDIETILYSFLASRWFFETDEFTLVRKKSENKESSHIVIPELIDIKAPEELLEALSYMKDQV